MEVGDDDDEEDKDDEEADSKPKADKASTVRAWAVKQLQSIETMKSFAHDDKWPMGVAYFLFTHAYFVPTETVEFDGHSVSNCSIAISAADRRACADALTNVVADLITSPQISSSDKVRIEHIGLSTDGTHRLKKIYDLAKQLTSADVAHADPLNQESQDALELVKSALKQLEKLSSADHAKVQPVVVRDLTSLLLYLWLDAHDGESESALTLSDYCHCIQDIAAKFAPVAKKGSKGETKDESDKPPFDVVRIT